MRFCHGGIATDGLDLLFDLVTTFGRSQLSLLEGYVNGCQSFSCNRHQNIFISQ